MWHLWGCRPVHKLTTNETVALKLLQQNSNTEEAKAEEAMLKKLMDLDAHKFNIVRWNESFTFEGHYCLEFEKLDISLYELMQNRQPSFLQLQEIRPIVQQLAVALDFLKCLGILHADLKPENIMMISRGPVHESDDASASDEIASLVDLIKASDNKSENEDPASEQDLDKFVDLLTQMLNVDSAERITPRQTLQHPFITMEHLIVKSCVELMNACEEPSFESEETSHSTAGPAENTAPNEDSPAGLSCKAHSLHRKTIIMQRNSPFKRKRDADDVEDRVTGAGPNPSIHCVEGRDTLADVDLPHRLTFISMGHTSYTHTSGPQELMTLKKSEDWIYWWRRKTANDDPEAAELEPY
ncbi:hypothetical protein INR49_002279 [Caranx melampygus]|nr:hypothetical protein INR49_002279 [Caranx melampygus]